MIIYRYILKELLGPFVFSLTTLMFLFLFQFLFKSIDQLVGKGLSLWVIIQLISLNLAWMITLAVPMSVLVATLMAFGNLSSSNEITIMKASGIGLHKLMIPVIIVSAAVTYLMILFNNDVLPEANHNARLLLQDITKTKPTFILEPGKFSDEIGNARILVRKTFDNSNKIEGVYIYDKSTPEYRNLLTAEKGDIGFTSDFKNIVLNLENGEIHQIYLPDVASKYRKINFKNHRIILDASGFGFQRSSDNAFIRGDRELSADAMSKIVDSLLLEKNNFTDNIIESMILDIKRIMSVNFKNSVVKQSNSYDKEYDTLSLIYRTIITKPGLIKTQIQNIKLIETQIDIYEVEIYKKYSIPFACLVFALIGAPLGYRVKKGGFGVAAGLSLFFFLIYWASLIGGEKLADRHIVSPFMGMWLINIILGIFGLYLMFKSS